MTTGTDHLKYSYEKTPSFIEMEKRAYQEKKIRCLKLREAREIEKTLICKERFLGPPRQPIVTTRSPTLVLFQQKLEPIHEAMRKKIIEEEREQRRDLFDEYVDFLEDKLKYENRAYFSSNVLRTLEEIFKRYMS